jgi:hypothetical protein
VNEHPDLSSAALAPDGGVATLAYWLGPCNIAAVQDVDAVSIAQVMAYQYDIEEQADRTGVVIPADVDWREHFMPVAPVQLTRAWSPLPSAIQLLGSPDWISVGEPDILGKRAAACAWTSPRFDGPAPVPTRSPDAGRFHRLLVLAVMRAGDSGRGILAVAKPGWSCDHAGISSETARLMRAAGFAVQDRHA